VTSNLEVEELPTQAVGPHSTSRIPLTGAIAVGAVGILLAAGFGLLGGRTGVALGSPIPSQVADASSPASPPVVTQPTGEPLVSPWGPCGDAGDDVPMPYLKVDGVQHVGRVEQNVRGPGQDIDVFDDEPGEDLERVEVPMDALTEIWMPGGRCANAWYIAIRSYDDPVPVVLESVSNDALDPAIASQNRFELFVAPYEGDFDLGAIFALEDVSLRATWLIHVPELAPPDVSLRAGAEAIQTVIGCGAVQRVANGLAKLLVPCTSEVGHKPSRATDVAPGQELDFAIDGWVSTGMTITCGQTVDGRYIRQLDPACLLEGHLGDGGIRFAAPGEAGTWTLAISSCATPGRFIFTGVGELCGTWYADIRVRA
jgi:hypothetical protein